LHVQAQGSVALVDGFQALSDSLVEVNEKICQLRPVQGEEAFSEQEKKRRKRSGRKSRKK
jgi:hypothetical protein